MDQSATITESLKAELLGELHLMTPAGLKAYWKQVTWLKPNLVKLAKSKSSPLAFALRQLRPERLAEASEQPDPFGWLLEVEDVTAWSKFCEENREPWATRVWLATASQLRAERRLIHKAHGWAGTWEESRRNRDKSDEFFFAQLRHAAAQRKAELLANTGLAERVEQARQENDQGWLRRFRRNKQDLGAPYGVTAPAKYMVQHWLEMTQELPGLCFFSDCALDALFDVFGLKTGQDWATKQVRVRLGLIQAGAKQHWIENVITVGGQLRFTGSFLKKPITFDKDGITWGKCQLKPRLR
jgi:hypothetical protein